MRFYLVIWSGADNDLPVRLFADRLEATAFAKSLGWEPPESHPLVRGDGTPVNLSILEFHDGEPVDHWIVRTFEQEPYIPVPKPF